MLKNILISTTLILLTTLFAGCVDSSPTLPAPYNDLYSLQQSTANELSTASQKMEKITSQPKALIEQATTLDKFIREKKEEIISMAVADAESSKADTITELETAKQLASSIKTNATKLLDDPSSETVQKLIIGYISRLKTQSTKLEQLQKQLEKVALPDRETTEEPETNTQPVNPRASEATI